MILPDTTTSPRWENNDRPSLDAAFKAAGVGSDIQNAGGDTAKFGTICDSMINEGVKVLMIVNLDPDSGAACLKKATAAGITSIDYDRLTPGGGASYYVSFDNVKVGELMGQGLADLPDGRRQEDRQHHLHQRCRDRQQRRPVQGGLRQGAQAEDRLGRLQAGR